MSETRKHQLAKSVRKKLNAKRKKTFKLEKKTSSKTNIDLLGGYSFGNCFRGWHFVRAMTAWRYYKSVAPVGDAVNKTARGFLTIKPAIFDTQEKVYIDEVDSRIKSTKLLQLLKKPNQEDTTRSFLDKIIKSFQVTGEYWIVITAINEDSDPMEIFYVDPKNVNDNGTDSNNITQSWVVTDHPMSSTYFRTETNDDSIIYITKDGKRQLCQVKNFNPDESNGDPRGFSDLNQIFLEIEQYELSGVHNGSTLKNGARPSALLMLDPEVDLDDDQFARAEQQLKDKFQGPENAGAVMICEGGKDLKLLSQTNKDMDFLELIKSVVEQIYRNLEIPQPLINASAMTMNNYAEAKFMFFDMRIIPLATIIYEGLNKCLMRRVDDTERYELSFEISKIPAIKVRENQEVDRKIGSGVLKVDESRTLLGFEELENGQGDVLLISSSDVPIGTEPEQIDANSKSRLISALEKKGWSDKQINDKIESLYG